MSSGVLSEVGGAAPQGLDSESTLLHELPLRSLAPMGKLRVLDGVQKGKELPLTDVTISFGRGSDNTIVFPDASASRRHFKLHMKGDTYELEDLGSGNGVAVNGQRVRGSRVLEDGDRIEVGSSLLQFVLPSASGKKTTGKRSRMPLVIGLAVGLLLTVGGGLTGVLLLRDKPGVVPTGIRPGSILVRGTVLYRQRKWNEAVEAFQKAVKEDPRNPEAARLLDASRSEAATSKSLGGARKLIQGGKYGRARDLLLKINRELTPGSVYGEEVWRALAHARRMAVRETATAKGGTRTGGEVATAGRAGRAAPAGTGGTAATGAKAPPAGDPSAGSPPGPKEDPGGGSEPPTRGTGDRRRRTTTTTTTTDQRTTATDQGGSAPPPHATGQTGTDQGGSAPPPHATGQTGTDQGTTTTDTSGQSGTDQGTAGPPPGGTQTNSAPARHTYSKRLCSRVGPKSRRAFKEGRLEDAEGMLKACRQAGQAAKIGKFRQAWNAGRAAHNSRQPRIAIASLQRALEIDLEFSGGTSTYASQIKGMLANMFAFQGYFAISKKAYATARQRFLSALRYHPGHGMSKRQLAELRRIAKGKYDHAMKVKASEPDSARKLMRKVMALVDPNDPLYKKAARFANH